MFDKLGNAMPRQWTGSIMRVWTVGFRLKSFSFERFQNEVASLIWWAVTSEVDETTNGKNNCNPLWFRNGLNGEIK